MRKGSKKKKERTELDNAEKKFQSLVDKRNELNSEANIYRDERDAIHNQKKKLLEEAREKRVLRNTLVKEMREHKKKRNEMQKKAKELIAFKQKRGGKIEKNLPQTIEEIRKEMARMEIKQETTSMPIDDEKELLEKIKTKAKELKELEKLMKEQVDIVADVEELDAKIDELFKEADKEHEEVVRLSDESQEHHERVTTLMKESSVLINEAQKKHEKYIKIRERATKFHEKAMEMRKKVLDMKKEKRMERAEARKLINEQNIAVKKALDDEEELDKAAKASVEKLMKKGKVEM
jgi:uncharacterized coiled-coil DUF342 family protein